MTNHSLAISPQDAAGLSNTLAGIRMAVDTCRNPTWLKDLHDGAEGIRRALQHRDSELERQNQASEIVLRIERAYVALVAPTVRPGNPQLSPGGQLPGDVDRQRFYRWRQISSPEFGGKVTDEAFEQYLDAAKGSGDEVTRAALLRFVGAGTQGSVPGAVAQPAGIVAGHSEPVPTDRTCPKCAYEWASVGSDCPHCAECPMPECGHRWLL